LVSLMFGYPNTYLTKIPRRLHVVEADDQCIVRVREFLIILLERRDSLLHSFHFGSDISLNVIGRAGCIDTVRVEVDQGGWQSRGTIVASRPRRSRSRTTAFRDRQFTERTPQLAMHVGPVAQMDRARLPKGRSSVQRLSGPHLNARVTTR
jgi:hypothetical protein